MTMKPPPAMKTKLARRPNSAPLSVTFWPVIGSCTWAWVVPALVSISAPAASKAHMTPAIMKPITPPMNASLANSASHCQLLSTSGAGAGCSIRLSSAMATNIALRTSAGTSSCEKGHQQKGHRHARGRQTEQQRRVAQRAEDRQGFHRRSAGAISAAPCPRTR
jgi:hypothetical protein